MTGVDSPALVINDKCGIVAEKIHISFPERGDSSNVLPISCEGICEHSFLVCEHRGNDVLTKVVFTVLVLFVSYQIVKELFLAEYIDSHRSLRTVGILGLLRELVYLTFIIYAHNSESACFLYRNVDNGDSTVSIHLLMEIEHLGVIHLVYMVA